MFSSFFQYLERRAQEAEEEDQQRWIELFNFKQKSHVESVAPSSPKNKEELLSDTQESVAPSPPKNKEELLSDSQESVAPSPPKNKEELLSDSQELLEKMKELRHKSEALRRGTEGDVLDCLINRGYMKSNIKQMKDLEATAEFTPLHRELLAEIEKDVAYTFCV